MSAREHLQGQQFFHASTRPPEEWGAVDRPDYIHVGTRAAAESIRRVGSKSAASLYEVHISPQQPLNQPNKPIDDSIANRISLTDSVRHTLGRMPRRMDLDEAVETAPIDARQAGWRPRHDAVFYQNAEEDPGSTSALVRASAIRSIRKLD